MLFCRIKIVLLVLTVFAVLTSRPCLGNYDYIDITNPFLRKIPMAISCFSTVNRGNDEVDLAAKNRELLRKSLEFTSYFSIIHNKTLTPDNGSKTALTRPNFKKWTDSGAEILITGNVEIINKSMKLELRLYDTVNKKMLFGKSYKTAINNSRRVIHRFCSEVIYYITGSRGIFYSKIAFLSSVAGKKRDLHLRF